MGVADDLGMPAESGTRRDGEMKMTTIIELVSENAWCVATVCIVVVILVWRLRTVRVGRSLVLVFGGLRKGF